jgi:hypothetical protein
VANNPVNRIDPYGLWSFTIGAYYGYGGTITVGSDSGKTFIMVEAGVGIGGKAKYKPFGKFPDVPCKEKSDAGAFIGAGGGAGGYLGPLALFWEGKLGLGVSKTGDLLQTNYIEKGAPEVGIQKGWGFGLGIHGGVQVGVLF